MLIKWSSLHLSNIFPEICIRAIDVKIGISDWVGSCGSHINAEKLDPNWLVSISIQGDKKNIILRMIPRVLA